jgi:hypothetical protein
MRALFPRKAQSLTEIALILATIGLVFVGMEIYVRRGLQGRVKDLTDGFLGRQQTDYQMDINNFEVLDSSSVSSYSSQTNKAITEGGGQRVAGQDVTDRSFTSESDYKP